MVSKLAGQRRVDRGKLDAKKKAAAARLEKRREGARRTLFHEALVALEPRFAQFDDAALDAARTEEDAAYYQIMAAVVALHESGVGGDTAGDAGDDDGGSPAGQ